MRWRCAGPLVLGICCLAAAPAPKSSPDGEARRLWDKGQRAILAGDADGAIAAYRESLRLDPHLSRNHLSLAAAYLEKGQDAAAAEQMYDYLRLQPEHVVVRLHLAELMLRLGRQAKARDEFERFIAEAQTRPELAAEHLVHCHSQLMEMAVREGDEYGEHLHRGVGLYLLAKQRQTLPDPDGELSTEALLCKAAGELALAFRARPDEARPCWYLASVWTELGQRGPATRWLRSAEAAAPFSSLTPCEREGLRLGCLRLEADARKR